MSRRSVESPEAPSFATPLDVLPGVGPVRGQALAARGLHRLLDLLHFVPVRYRLPPPLRDSGPWTRGTSVSVVGHVLSRRRGQSRRFARGFAEVQWEGPRGALPKVRFYNQPWMFDRLLPGTRLMVCGRLSQDEPPVLVPERHHLLNADADVDELMTRPVPVWPKVPGVPAGILSRLLQEAAARVEALPDPLPDAVRQPLGLWPLHQAVAAVHGPTSVADAEEGGARLLFDRLVAWLRPAVSPRPTGGATAISVTGADWERILSCLPFPLTPGQAAALQEILLDLGTERPMRRLLQGDVGSGKTAVAVASALAAVGCGRQVLLIAPTAPLARQHFELLTRWLATTDIHCAYYGGHLPAAERQRWEREAVEGSLHLVCATQAALTGRLRLPKLGLVIIDEQHRFGVRQRLMAGKLGTDDAHVLSLSATPIPRSLCLALYGDLDHVTIPDRPPGRLPVITQVSTGRVAVAAVKAAVMRGERAFIVFPSIDAEEMPALLREGQKLLAESGGLFGVPVALAHGRQTPEERDQAFMAFASGAAAVLLTTLVVEVGIDVPEATVMVVVGAERFGLASLHQLRGRVGRGGAGGQCFLVPGKKASSESQGRLRVLESESDGFRIAEADLLLRGPGEMLGLRQSGAGGWLPLAPGRDLALVERALETARTVAATLEASDYWPLLGATFDAPGGVPRDAV